jgi:hypothetical protein
VRLTEGMDAVYPSGERVGASREAFVHVLASIVEAGKKSEESNRLSLNALCSILPVKALICS